MHMIISGNALKKSRQSFATELWIEHVNSVTIE